MGKFSIGSAAVVSGALVLSLELYGLKIVQCMEMTKGSWYTNASDYAREPVLGAALWITSAVIVFGAALMVYAVFEKKRDREKLTGYLEGKKSSIEQAPQQTSGSRKCETDAEKPGQ